MKKILLLLSFFTIIGTAQERQHFKTDVEVIKAYEKIYTPEANPIVFTGSSSIRAWKHLQVAFGPYNVINRGVGGAVIDDITFHVDDLVARYNPRQVVIYVGENDLVSEKETAATILDKTVELYKALRAKMPNVPIIYISMKPSPERDKHRKKCREANELIRKFFASEKNAQFVDVYTPMLKDGEPRPELFTKDMLHMNQDGYTVWEKLVKPYLIKPVTK